MTSYPPRPRDPRVGKTLNGKWTLNRLIGIGGMASVYAAKHRNGLQAAIKILHPQFARNTEARTRFKREAYIANKAGPGAVEVKDDDIDDDGSPYLVMELLRGQSVDRRADSVGGRLDVADVLWIAAQTLVTLEIAHNSGIVHRDLKPENLFWTDDGRLKVLDFGIARLRDATSAENTRSGMVLGTPNFMSPEQALGKEDIDARTDIWAVGAIMFRLLTGRDVHMPGVNVLVAAATQRAPSLGSLDRSLPDDVVDIVDRALKFERDERYLSAEQMRGEVDRAADVDAFDATIPAARAIPAGPTGARADPGSPLGDDGPPQPLGVPRGAQQYPTPLGGPIKPAAGRPPDPHVAFARPPTPPATPPPSSPDPKFAEPEDGGLATQMSDDDSLSLRDLLGLVELALRSRAEFGPAHPQSIRDLDLAFRNATAALSKAHIGLFWNVLPEGFVARQRELLWRARPPLAPSPRTMFAGGVRMLGLLPEIKPDEFESLVRLIGGDVAPFSDFASFLQSGQHEHIVYRLEPTSPTADAAGRRVSLDPSPGGVNVPSMLEALSTAEPAMRATLLDRLERWGEGHETQIVKVLAGADVDLAMGLLRVLSALGSEEAREAMLKATRSRHSVVRVEALSKLQAGHQRLHAELREMFGETDPKLRLETLVGVERHKIDVVGPALALRIRSPSFDMLPVDERRQALSTLGALLPSRAEATAIQILHDRRSAMHEAREVSRELACELLGSVATTREARDALEATSTAQDRNSERVRSAALRAIASFDARAAATPRQSEPPHSPSRPPRYETPGRLSVRPGSRSVPSKRLPSGKISVPPSIGSDSRPPDPSAPPPKPSDPRKPPRTITHQRLPKVDK